MLAELTMCWALTCDPKNDAKRDIEVVCADRFKESERERRKKEEYERIFKLLLDEVQIQN